MAGPCYDAPDRGKQGDRVARVLLANELGNGDAPVRRALPLALALRERGHEPLLALNDLPKAEPALGDRGLRLLQCPLWRSRVGGLPPVHTYTDILLRYGFVHAVGLRGVARAWRDLVELLQPDILVLDHAPVALYATRGLGVPRLRFGDGFGCPPLTTPMPPMTWWDPTPEPFDQIGERNALHVANLAAAELGLPAAASVAELLRPDGEALCILRELDCYPGREGGVYCGALTAPDEGAETPWPGGDGACCFVALRAQHAQLPALVEALRSAGQRAVLQLADCTPEQAAALSGDGIVVARTPVPVAQVRQHCSHAVTDGHGAITQALLLAGKPLLLLPTLLEQSMLARRVVDLGAGRLLDGPAAAEPLAQALRQLVDEPAWVDAAQAFAERHRDQDDRRTLDAVMAQIDALLTTRPPQETHP